MYKLIFDVNGTLTPLNQPIDSEFRDYFLNIIKTYDTILLSNETEDIIKYQLGDDILSHINLILFGDKIQLMNHISISNDEIYFFADSIYPGGNDFNIGITLGHYINTIYRVQNWKETYGILYELINI